MKYMLNTNMCIYAITYAELMHGVEKSLAVEKNRVAMTLFLSPITILEFNYYAAEEYGKIRADFERKGTPIGSLNMLITGHAKSKNLILVTNNTREFFRIVDVLQKREPFYQTAMDIVMAVSNCQYFGIHTFCYGRFLLHRLPSVSEQTAL